MRARKVLDGTLEARDRNKIQDFTILFICFFWRQQLNALCTDHFADWSTLFGRGPTFLSSHWSRASLVMLAGSLWHNIAGESITREALDQ